VTSHEISNRDSESGQKQNMQKKKTRCPPGRERGEKKSNGRGCTVSIIIKLGLLLLSDGWERLKKKKTKKMDTR